MAMILEAADSWKEFVQCSPRLGALTEHGELAFPQFLQQEECPERHENSS